MRPSHGHLVGLLVAFGCAEQRAEFVAWPELGEARTAILHQSLAEGARSEVLKLEAGAPERERLQLEIDEPGVLELFLYDRTPEELGLEPGLLESSPGSVSLVDPATNFRRRWRLEFDAGASALTWTDGQGAPLPGLGLAEASAGCAPFDVEVLEMGLSSDPLLVEVNELGQHRVLYREGALVTYEGERVSLVNYQLLAAARVGAHWWVMDGYGNLYDLDPDQEPAAIELRLRTYGDMTEGYWIAGFQDEAHTEIYTLTRSGRLELWDGSVRRLLHQLPDSMVSYHDRGGGLVWLGPQRVLAAWASSPEVISLSAEVVSTEPTGSSLGLVSLRALPSGRIAAGDASGGIHLRAADGAWSTLPDSELRLWPFTFGEFGERLVYGTALGSFASHHPRHGFCAPIQPYYSASFRVMTVTEDAIYLGGTARGGGVLLRLRERR